MKAICPTFQLVFFTVVLLTVLSGGTTLSLASQKELTEYQVRVLENTNATWLTGTGAIFGLLGSKATELLESKDDEDSKGG